MTDQGSAQERPNYGSQSGQGETQIGPIPGYPAQGGGYQGQGHPGGVYGGPAAGYPGQGGAYQGQAQEQQAAYPGQAGYQGQPAGYGPSGGQNWAPPAGSASAKGFMASLFDFEFNSFVTPKIVKVVYILMMVLLGLFALGVLISALNSGSGLLAVLGIVIAVVAFFVELALWRIGLEIIMVIFRMSDDIRAIRDRGQV